MSLDVVDLRNFYTQQLGMLARRFIGLKIRARWPDAHGQRVVGLGYTTRPISACSATKLSAASPSCLPRKA